MGRVSSGLIPTWMNEGALGLALAASLAACSASGHSRRAERAAERILAERTEAVVGVREEKALQPSERPAAPAGEGAAEEAPAPVEPGASDRRASRTLDLRAALAIAFESNRTMLARKEDLRVRALSLSSVRRDFGPQLALALGYVFDETRGSLDANSGSAAFSTSQLLPTGAVLSLDASTGAAASEGESALYDSLVSVRLVQPLLRGGGHAVTHEPLIQAERNLVYALRDFELFREDFSIDVARRYYDLVNQKQTIDNQRRNLESNEFARRKADALFAVGRTSELDVLRARREELNAQNGLLEAEEGLKLALDNFRIFLGLPEEEPVDVLSDSPPFTAVSYEVESAIEVALANRLDFLNRREQLEDVERGVRLARNTLLPDLSLDLGTSYATGSSGSLGGTDLDRTESSLALTLGVPLDRVRERNSYRSAEIGLAQARRDLEQFEDELVVEIRSSFRELERRLQSLDIQRQIIKDQTKNKRIAELRFERGEIENRDVVEATQSLLDAENRLIDEQVSYEIARLQLLRNLGILFIDETGMWKE
jgi:outer membrane protein TolC